MTFFFPTPTPILPTLNSFSVKKKPAFSSIVAEPVSGAEITAAVQAFPLWDFELTYEILRSQTQNQILYSLLSPKLEYEAILSVFLACEGQYGRFYYDDPTDDSRSGQFIAEGNGTTVQFRAVRYWALGGNSLLEPVGGINTTPGWKVYLNAVDDSANWSVSADKLYFVRTSAVPPSTVITADFWFFYLCRFLEDISTFEQFVTDRWTNTSLKFRSVKQ